LTEDFSDVFIFIVNMKFYFLTSFTMKIAVF